MNNSQIEYNGIGETVLEKISAGKVKMRPKFYFLVKVAVLFATTFCAFLTSALIVSYIIFSLSESGHLFLLGFGLKGFLSFLLYFPWFLLFIDVVFLFVLDFLVKSFEFGYSHSFVSLLAGTVFSILIIGLIIFLTPFHNLLLERAEKNELPVVGDYYKDIKDPLDKDDLFVGIVRSINGNTLFIEDGTGTNKKLREVIVPDSINPGNFIVVGDNIIVAGNMASGTIYSYGIRKLDRVVK